jgi:hypothetical protein
MKIIYICLSISVDGQTGDDVGLYELGSKGVLKFSKRRNIIPYENCSWFSTQTNTVHLREFLSRCLKK